MRRCSPQRSDGSGTLSATASQLSARLNSLIEMSGSSQAGAGSERLQASRGSVPRPWAHVQGFRPTHNIHRLASEARPCTAQRPFPSASPLVRILYSMLVRRVEFVTTSEVRVARQGATLARDDEPRGARPSAEGGENDRDFWAVPAGKSPSSVSLHSAPGMARRPPRAGF